MKKYLLKLLTLLLVVFSLGSCNDPIFYTVTQETPVIKPYINGSPMNFAILNNEMYTASGNQIYKYYKNGSKCEWSRFENLGDYVGNLAATANSLYVIYLSGDSGKIKRYYNNGNSSEEVVLSGNIQSIFSSDNILFTCVRNNQIYIVYYRKEGEDFKEIHLEVPVINDTPKPLSSILNGVASDSNYYYLCTYLGIFYVKKDEIDSASEKNILKEKEFTDYRFAKNTAVSTAPSYTANANDPGNEWTDRPPVLSTSEYLWMIQARWRGLKRLSDWTKPVRISGTVDDATGSYHELLYVMAATRPDTPSGDIPANWTTDLSSITGPDPLWMSRGIKDASGVLQGKWSDPVQITSEKEEGGEDKILTGFTGIINLNDNYIAAITIKGDIYEITDAVITKTISFSDGRDSTGALAIWKDKDNPTKNLLLVGRMEYYQSTTSGYSNGYVEIEIDTTTGGIKEGAEFNVPGKSSPTSIDNYDRYVSSLGKKIINYFIQAPSSIDSNMTLFASTQKDGVWSYRTRNGEKLWNSEQRENEDYFQY